MQPIKAEEETKNLNTPITTKELQLAIVNLPTKKSPAADDFTG